MSPAPVATSVASTGARPPQTKVNLLKIFPSKYSPKKFGSKYFPQLAIFSTQHKYTSYQLGVSDACEDLSWLNWCKTSSDKGYFSSKCFSLLAKYGVGPCPPGWPSPLNWSNFKGPGKQSVGMCEEIIHAMKVHQSQQGAVGGGQPQQVADHGLGDLGYDDLANLVDRAEVVLQLQEEGGEEVGEQVDEVA